MIAQLQSQDIFKLQRPQGPMGMPQGRNQDVSLFNQNGTQPTPPQDAQGMNPDEYLEYYMEINNITDEEEAKKELQSLYGDPQEPTQSTETTNTSLTSKDDSEVKDGDPNKLVEQIMEQYDLTQQEAIDYLVDLYGEPQSGFNPFS